MAGSEARLPADLALEAQVGQTRRLKATASPCSPSAVWTWWSGGWDQALGVFMGQRGSLGGGGSQHHQVGSLRGSRCCSEEGGCGPGKDA